MDIDPQRLWCRRVAAMRAFHLLVAGITLLQILGLLALVVLVVVTRSTDQLPIVVIPLVAILVGLAVALARYRVFARKDPRHIGCAFAIEEFPSLQQVQAEATQLGLTSQNIEFRAIVNRDASPAQIFQGRDKTLYCLMRVELLAHREPSLVAAIIWHELGHHFQWDTRFGYWTLTAVDRFGQTALWLGGTGVVFVGSTLTYLALQHRATRVSYYALILEIAAALFLFAVLWFMRHWRRFAEFNADQLAALAGYGQPLVEYLSQMPSRNWTILTLFGFHPAPKRRARALDLFLERWADNPRLGSAADQASLPRATVQRFHSGTIRFRDYAYGVCFYVAPLWLLFSASALGMALAMGMFGAQIRSEIQPPVQYDPHRLYVVSTAQSTLLRMQDYDIRLAEDELKFHADLADAMRQGRKPPVLACIKHDRKLIMKIARAKEAAAQATLSYSLPANLPDPIERQLKTARDNFVQAANQDAGAYRLLLTMNDNNVVQVLKGHFERLNQSSQLWNATTREFSSVR